MMDASFSAANGNLTEPIDTRAISVVCLYSFQERWLIYVPPALTVADSTSCLRYVFFVLRIFIAIKRMTSKNNIKRPACTACTSPTTTEICILGQKV